MNNIERIVGKYKYKKLLEYNIYARCDILIYLLFKNKFDKEGEPYINHLYRVSANMSSINGKIAGLLHDVVEDIDGVTFNDLKDFGVPDEVIAALKLVTNEKEVSVPSKEEKLKRYNEKIDKIINSGNELAIELKFRDMSDNYNKDRIKKLSPELQEWFKLKYELNLKKFARSEIEKNIKKRR